MNPIFSRLSISYFRLQPYLGRFIILANITFLLLSPLIRYMRAQTSSDSTVEFKKLAAQLSTARLDGAAESEASEEMALGISDKLGGACINGPRLREIDG